MFKIKRVMIAEVVGKKKGKSKDQTMLKMKKFHGEHMFIQEDTAFSLSRNKFQAIYHHHFRRFWNNPKHLAHLLHCSAKALFLGTWGVRDLGSSSIGLQGIQDPLKL